MPLSLAATAGLTVSSTDIASPVLNATAVTEVVLPVPATVKRAVPGALVVFSASLKDSVSVDPFTDALRSVGAGRVRCVVRHLLVGEVRDEVEW